MNGHVYCCCGEFTCGDDITVTFSGVDAARCTDCWAIGGGGGGRHYSELDLDGSYTLTTLPGTFPTTCTAQKNIVSMFATSDFTDATCAVYVSGPAYGDRTLSVVLDPVTFEVKSVKIDGFGAGLSAFEWSGTANFGDSLTNQTDACGSQAAFDVPPLSDGGTAVVTRG